MIFELCVLGQVVITFWSSLLTGKAALYDIFQAQKIINAFLVKLQSNWSLHSLGWPTQKCFRNSLTKCLTYKNKPELYIATSNVILLKKRGNWFVITDFKHPHLPIHSLVDLELRETYCKAAPWWKLRFQTRGTCFDMFQKKLEWCELRTSQIAFSSTWLRNSKMPESLVEVLAISHLTQEWHDHPGAMFGLHQAYHLFQNIGTLCPFQTVKLLSSSKLPWGSLRPRGWWKRQYSYRHIHHLTSLGVTASTSVTFFRQRNLVKELLHFKAPLSNF